jgi:hypothetical protein
MLTLMLESVRRKDDRGDLDIDALARRWDSLSPSQLRGLVDDLCEVGFVLAIAWRDDGGSYEDLMARLAATALRQSACSLSDVAVDD